MLIPPLLALLACARPSPPPAPAAAAPDAPAAPDGAVPGFGPVGAVLVGGPEQQWHLETDVLRLPLLDAAGAHPCDIDPERGHEAVLVDVEGDGWVELFVSGTHATGAGAYGAVDQDAVCGWRWSRETGAAEHLPALSAELSGLGITDAASITAHLAAQRAAPRGWRALAVDELPRPGERTRAFQAGPHRLQIRQSGLYTAAIEVVSGGAPREAAAVFSLDPAAVGAASRPWDFEGQWEPVAEACCALDLRPARDGESLRISGAWLDGAITYVLVRQEQSAHAPACQVVRVAAAGAGPHDEDCAAFEARLP